MHAIKVSAFLVEENDDLGKVKGKMKMKRRKKKRMKMRMKTRKDGMKARKDGMKARKDAMKEKTKVTEMVEEMVLTINMTELVMKKC
jgi:hypothetical protein